MWRDYLYRQYEQNIVQSKINKPYYGYTHNDKEQKYGHNVKQAIKHQIAKPQVPQDRNNKIKSMQGRAM